MSLQGITTVRDWLSRGEVHLRRGGVDESLANAELLLAHVLEVKRPEVQARLAQTLTEKQRHHYWHLVLERGKRKPLAYVLGDQPFLGLAIEVTPAVLIPRPETEELAEAVLETAKKELEADPKRILHILEVGTGSGCISVALAHFLPGAIVYATDISQAALHLAEKNACRHRVERRIRFLREDLFRPEALSGGPWADFLVSNPPYIPTAQLPKLDAEVRMEPFLALDGGKDGLDAIRAILASAPKLLKPRGWLALEIGESQAGSVRGLLERPACLFEGVQVRKDLQGKDRVVLARRALR
ncbi:MAG TPA: peptide chain release factor N(5)-glutamine methyltransferase [Elusimicrobia bacterium]|nr:peptide chain release factor N(5)-glutamine methyltransferase [Elusimicrobiota bacterium]